MQPSRVTARVLAAVLAVGLLYLAYGAFSGVWDPEQDNSDSTYVVLALMYAAPGLVSAWVALRGLPRRKARPHNAPTDSAEL